MKTVFCSDVVGIDDSNSYIDDNGNDINIVNEKNSSNSNKSSIISNSINNNKS